MLAVDYTLVVSRDHDAVLTVSRSDRGDSLAVIGGQAGRAPERGRSNYLTLSMTTISNRYGRFGMGTADEVTPSINGHLDAWALSALRFKLRRVVLSRMLSAIARPSGRRSRECCLDVGCSLTCAACVVAGVVGAVLLALLVGLGVGHDRGYVLLIAPVRRGVVRRSQPVAYLLGT